MDLLSIQIDKYEIIVNPTLWQQRYCHKGKPKFYLPWQRRLFVVKHVLGVKHGAVGSQARTGWDTCPASLTQSLCSSMLGSYLASRAKYPALRLGGPRTSYTPALDLRYSYCYRVLHFTIKITHKVQRFIMVPNFKTKRRRKGMIIRSP